MGRGDKMFLDIAGLPLLGHTWRRFDLLSEADEIILVTRDDARPVLEDLAKRINAQKPWQLVAGGVERQDSVWNGVNATTAKSEIIAIQDGARPCTPSGEEDPGPLSSLRGLHAAGVPPKSAPERKSAKSTKMVEFHQI